MRRLLAAVVVGSALCSCSGPSAATSPCPDPKDVLFEVSDGGIRYFVAADGNVYRESGDGCAVFERYFTPGFEADNYAHVGDSVYIKTSEGLFPIRNAFLETFETYSGLPDLFLRSVRDTNRIWSTMTLQSPLAPSVADYVALRTCILSGTCSFRDNRIDLSPDPMSPANTAMKFTAVAPSGGLQTSKASIETTIAYFKKGDDLWYQARYYFADEYPYSVVDFESQWFSQSPGPRIVLDNGALAVEDKFGAKPTFRQVAPVVVPKGQWVTIKAHLVFHETNGTIELWQDGRKILAATGATLPVPFAIQTNIEVGISATDRACVVYVDDVRLSPKPF